MAEFTAGTRGPCSRCDRDRLVGELLDVHRLPVVLQPARQQRVEERVERGVRHRADHLGDRPGHVAELLQHRLALGVVAGPARDHDEERLAHPVLRDERQRRREVPGRVAAVLPRRVDDEVRKYAAGRRRVGELEEHQPGVDVADRVQPERERGDHAEVAAAAAQRPEQVRVLGLAGGHRRCRRPAPPRRSSRLSQDRPCARVEVADPAAEGEPADAGGGDDAAGGREPVHGGGVVEHAPRSRRRRRSPSGRPGRPRHAAHRRQVDHDRVVGGAEAGHAVPAAAHREVEAAVAGVVHGRLHVVGVGAAHDRGRMPVDHEVVDVPGVFVLRVIGAEHRAADALGQCGSRCHGCPPCRAGRQRAAACRNRSDARSGARPVMTRPGTASSRAPSQFWLSTVPPAGVNVGKWGCGMLRRFRPARPEGRSRSLSAVPRRRQRPSRAGPPSVPAHVS